MNIKQLKYSWQKRGISWINDGVDRNMPIGEIYKAPELDGTLNTRRYYFESHV
jgi:hypothetical protein